MTLYSQRDPRWANVKFGASGTIGKLGCTTTCLAMLLDKNPDEVASKLDKAKAYSGNYIIWSRISLAFPQLKFVKRVKQYDNTEVRNNLPCLVCVDFDGTPRTDDQHWVIFVGGQKMYDPWTGTIRPTSTYPVLGYSIVKRVA